jgi:co-chaperonin GroES (HSP10)
MKQATVETLVGAGCETPAFKMEEFPLEALNDFVIVQRRQSAAVIKEGQLYLKDETLFSAPGEAKKSNIAKVIAVGEGRIIGGNLVPLSLKVGDEVVITKYGGTDFELDGEEFVLLRVGEVYARRKNADYSAT